MGTVVQAGICDLRKIIQWAMVKDQGEETNKKKKSSEFVFSSLKILRVIKYLDAYIWLQTFKWYGA